MARPRPGAFVHDTVPNRYQIAPEAVRLKKQAMMKQKALSKRLLAIALAGAVALPFTNGSSAADSEFSKETSVQQASRQAA
jgi:hypothetical protein